MKSKHSWGIVHPVSLVMFLPHPYYYIYYITTWAGKSADVRTPISVTFGQLFRWFFGHPDGRDKIDDDITVNNGIINFSSSRINDIKTFIDNIKDKLFVLLVSINRN